MSEPIPVRLPSDEQRDHLMVQAAKLYYDLERTQSEIAAELGLTRWQVSRLLREARETGIVRIEIIPRSQRRPDLETRLQKIFGLREAVVVPTAGGDDEGLALESVAQAAGQYLAGLNPKPALVGVSWGRTMAAVAHWLPQGWNDGVHVVLVNGATNLRATAARTNLVAEAFAKAGNGSATLLPVPAVVGKPATRAVLEEDPVIARVIELAEAAPVVLFGMGNLTAQSVLVSSGYIEPGEIDRLAALGAVGDILGRFIKADGSIADPTLDARTIGLRPGSLKRKDRAIGISAGKAKWEIVLAAVRAGFVNVLITDEPTARHIAEAGA